MILNLSTLKMSFYFSCREIPHIDAVSEIREISLLSILEREINEIKLKILPEFPDFNLGHLA